MTGEYPKTVCAKQETSEKLLAGRLRPERSRSSLPQTQEEHAKKTLVAQSIRPPGRCSTPGALPVLACGCPFGRLEEEREEENALGRTRPRNRGRFV